MSPIVLPKNALSASSTSSVNHPDGDLEGLAPPAAAKFASKDLPSGVGVTGVFIPRAFITSSRVSPLLKRAILLVASSPNNSLSSAISNGVRVLNPFGFLSFLIIEVLLSSLRIANWSVEEAGTVPRPGTLVVFVTGVVA